MKILEFSAEGFKVPDGTWALRDKDGPRDLVLVTGAPGSGKTLFLRLLSGLKEAFAPYGSPPDLRRFLRPGKTSGRLSASFALSDADLARAGALEREQRVVVDVEPSGAVCTGEMGLARALAPLDRAAPMTRWELFPAHRRLQTSDWVIAHPPLSAAIEDARRLGPDGSKYAVLRRVFHELALAQASSVAEALGSRGVALLTGETDRFAEYKAAVATMLPDLRLAAVELRQGTAVPWFMRRSGERVAIGELSASEEQGVLFAFASVWLGLEGAVVLVDSPEVHLATEQQAPFFERLLELGRGNQTIVATGSAALTAARAAHVVDLSWPAARRA